VTAGLLALPFLPHREKPLSPEPMQIKQRQQQPTASIPSKVDPRTARLSRFLAKLHCPVANLAAEFVAAADRNHLDWRLLPSISIIESGGGKAFRNNNIFGWGNGDLQFSSIKAGLQEVAYKLSRGPRYKNRDSVGKLHVYNPDEEYATRVVEVMNRIGPEGATRLPAS
jgi:hypothetical protein